MKLRSYSVTCNACPHQAEGQLEDGRYFFFWARGFDWEVGIGDSVDDAVGSCQDRNPFASGRDMDGNLSYGNAPEKALAIVEAVCSVLDISSKDTKNRR